MISEAFVEARSLVSRIDPRIRVAAAAGYTSVVAVCDDLTALVASLGVSALLVILARLPLLKVAGRLTVVAGFLALIWALLPLTYGGPVMGRLGPLVFHAPGVRLALQITLKSVAIVTAFIALVATMDIATLGHSLLRLGVPAKVAYLLLMTYRYIFVLEQEYQRLLRAARIRGFKPGTNLHSYRTFAYLVGMLFVRASNRAQRVHQAMKCRGFRGRFYSLARFRASAGSWLFALLMAAVCTGLIWMQTKGFSIGFSI